MEIKYTEDKIFTMEQVKSLQFFCAISFELKHYAHEYRIKPQKFGTNPILRKKYYSFTIKYVEEIGGSYCVKAKHSSYHFFCLKREKYEED